MYRAPICVWTENCCRKRREKATFVYSSPHISSSVLVHIAHCPLSSMICVCAPVLLGCKLGFLILGCVSSVCVTNAALYSIRVGNWLIGSCVLSEKSCPVIGMQQEVMTPFRSWTTRSTDCYSPFREDTIQVLGIASGCLLSLVSFRFCCHNHQKYTVVLCVFATSYSSGYKQHDSDHQNETNSREC